MRDRCPCFLDVPESFQDLMAKPTRLEVALVRSWTRDDKSAFIIELDSLPLKVLIEEAARGIRLYEFLSIERPGDLLNYCRVRPVEVPKYVTDLFLDDPMEFNPPSECGEGNLPFLVFDRAFYRDGDDTRWEAESWLDYRDQVFWRELTQDWLEKIKGFQDILRANDDYLVRREINRIDNHEHRRDFFPAIERSCRTTPWFSDHSTLSHPLFSMIETLISRDNIGSVSCPFTDYWLWRRLVEEQVRRSEQTGQPPRQALRLNGPDDGLRVPFEDWGGDVHIPYEGACRASLFIKPSWRRVFPEVDAQGGSLTDIVFGSGPILRSDDVCRSLLTDVDLGILKCARRIEVGDGWILYESNRSDEDEMAVVNSEPKSAHKVNEGALRVLLKIRENRAKGHKPVPNSHYDPAPKKT